MPTYERTLAVASRAGPHRGNNDSISSSREEDPSSTSARTQLETRQAELVRRVAAQRKALWDGDLQARGEWLGPAADELFGWEREFAQLRDWHRQHGHCDVPAGHPQFPQLGRWVSKQRQMLRRGQLLPVRRLKLESLGLGSRGAAEAAWELWFDQLVAFKEREGSCNVPLQYDPNPRLGLWLHQQRQFATSGLLKPHQLEALTTLGAL